MKSSHFSSKFGLVSCSIDFITTCSHHEMTSNNMPAYIMTTTQTVKVFDCSRIEYIHLAKAYSKHCCIYGV